MPIVFTGKLRLGTGIDKRAFYCLVPHCLDWLYHQVFDLRFVKGKLRGTCDLSEEMAKRRDQESFDQDDWAG